MLSIGPETSLPISCEPASDTYPVPDESSTKLYTLISPKSISVLASHLGLFFPTAVFPLESPAKEYAFLLYSCCPQFNCFDNIDQVTQIIHF